MFRTKIDIQPSREKITLRTPVVSIGSCFAQIIGKRLKSNKFQAEANPFGVVYNPISSFKLIELSIDRQKPEPQSYLENQSVHYNYYVHSDISALSRDDLERKLAARIAAVHEFLKNARWLMITLGTAFVYRRADTGEPVANCHKMPSQFFNRELLEVDDILNAFENVCKKLNDFNPNLKIILTVSPVRHIRDTLPGNSVSKATLRLACEKIASRRGHVDYFPSFELMMDDLRDYRFYAPDMLHPNELAENYVWEKFAATYFDDETKAFIKEWDKLAKAIAHNPFYPELPAHQDFLKKTIEKLNRLQDKVDVSAEIDLLKKQLK